MGAHPRQRTSAALPSAAAAIVGAILLCSSLPAEATVLLSLADPPNTIGASYNIAFIATEATTTIEFSGYQKYAYELVSGTSVSVNGGPNLLGGAWTFAAAAQGSYAGTVYDGTSVPALWFGGFVPGYYDAFSQVLVTTVGEEYDLSFTFFNNAISPPVSFALLDAFEAPVLPTSVLLVTTPTGLVGSIGSVPEPSTWAMAVTGFAILALTAHRRRLLARSRGRVLL